MKNNTLVTIGRVLMALLFVPAGISKIFGFAGTVGYIASIGLPLPALFAVGAIVTEVDVGLALLVGFHTRIAALFLAVFTLIAGFLFHAFWSAPEAMAQMQQVMFMKNIAIAGGLLVVAGAASLIKSERV